MPYGTAVASTARVQAGPKRTLVGFSSDLNAHLLWSQNRQIHSPWDLGREDMLWVLGWCHAVGWALRAARYVCGLGWRKGLLAALQVWFWVRSC